MVPLYAARIEDLGPGHFVKVECIACGHGELIPPSSLLHGLPPAALHSVLDLEPRLRCRECDAQRESDRVYQVGEAGLLNRMVNIEEGPNHGRGIANIWRHEHPAEQR
jgi:hypothetical protein